MKLGERLTEISHNKRVAMQEAAREQVQPVFEWLSSLCLKKAEDGFFVIKLYASPVYIWDKFGASSDGYTLSPGTDLLELLSCLKPLFVSAGMTCVWQQHEGHNLWDVVIRWGAK